ncbi:MAG: YdcF family protein [Desulfobacterales bacterium]|nr:YdcF family protein [Desulfobacterales bacterium]
MLIKLKKVIINISLLSNIALLIILFTPLTESLYKLVWVCDQPQKADVIVILSSCFPFPTQKGVLDFSTYMRLEKGLELYRLGYASKIIAFGGVWIHRAEKTTGQVMKEKLILYDVPKEDIFVQDDIIGISKYYDNLILLLNKYKNQFDFNKAIFVTSLEQSYRIKKCLKKVLSNPIVVTSEPFELSLDWGKRFQLFRRVMNEICFGIPEFYLKGRF